MKLFTEHAHRINSCNSKLTAAVEPNFLFFALYLALLQRGSARVLTFRNRHTVDLPADTCDVPDAAAPAYLFATPEFFAHYEVCAVDVIIPDDPRSCITDLLNNVRRGKWQWFLSEKNGMIPTKYEYIKRKLCFTRMD